MSQSKDSQSLEVEFCRDTTLVNEKVRSMLEQDYSTMGMIEASAFSGLEYDKLLNKYYKKLYNILDNEGKKALKETQRNWIKLRDTDEKLISHMKSQVYREKGGGTIWGVIEADTRADITRRRVIELFNYIQSWEFEGF